MRDPLVLLALGHEQLANPALARALADQDDAGRADDALAHIDTLLAMRPQVLVPGHGGLSTSAQADLQLTRDYLAYLREKMGAAAQEMEPFDDAYAKTDWSRFEQLPLFRAANRMNAYNTYLLMEQQGR